MKSWSSWKGGEPGTRLRVELDKFMQWQRISLANPEKLFTLMSFPF